MILPRAVLTRFIYYHGCDNRHGNKTENNWRHFVNLADNSHKGLYFNAHTVVMTTVPPASCLLGSSTLLLHNRCSGAPELTC